MTDRTASAGQPVHRLVFANQLRGLAALSVACSHLIGVYWLMREVVGYATFSPVQTGDPPPIVGAVTFAWFQMGPFGVGLFFLISGLVVPISLGEHSRGSFLLARLVRIYPTYMAALAIELIVLYASALNWERPFFYSFATIATNGLLINNLLGYPSIDLVNWTLSVELKFYLLLMIVAPSIRAGRIRVLFAYAVALCAGNAALHGTALARQDALQALSTEAVFVVFMFVGVLFNFRLRRLLSRLHFVAAVAAMSVLFVACWRWSPLDAQIPVVTLNYFYALGLFGVLYLVRAHVHAFRLFDFMAAISYPFYLMHSMLGYTVLKLAMLRWALSYTEALPLAVCVVGAVATLLHFTVERSTMRLGRRLSNRRRRLGAASAAQVQQSPGKRAIAPTA